MVPPTLDLHALKNGVKETVETVRFVDRKNLSPFQMLRHQLN